MKRRRYGWLLIIASILLVVCVSYVCVSMLRWELGLAVSAVGVLVTVLTVLTQEGMRQSFSAKRRIVFVGKSKSLFSQNILVGLKRGLQNSFPTNLVEILPNEQREIENLTFQINSLRHPDVASANAVVVVPVSDSPELWRALQALSHRGVYIVMIDHKVPNRVFYEGLVRIPQFVGSDLMDGGRLIAEAIIGQFKAGCFLAILLVGPRQSDIAYMRSSSCLYHLMLSGYSGQVKVQELADWDELSAVAAFTKAVDSMNQIPAIAVSGGKVCVFCGNDKNCLRIEKHIIDSGQKVQHSFALIGYDGVRSLSGELAVASSRLCVATVDVQPQMQGESAARAILEGYEGRILARSKNSLVPPKLLTSDSWV